MPRDNENEEIIFNEADHTYVHKATGQELLSVSKFISLFSDGFDKSGEILKKSAKKHGVTPEELRAQWDKKRDDAAARGTRVHTEIEKYIKTKKINTKSPYKKIVKEFSKIKFDGEIVSEKIVYSTELKLAGTADIVELFSDDEFKIWDLKTNEKLSSYSFGRKMLYPLNHLWDSTLQKYELQLSIYCYLMDLKGYWPREQIILWVNPKNEKIEQIKVNYLRKEVQNMIEFWKNRPDTDFELD